MKQQIQKEFREVGVDKKTLFAAKALYLWLEAKTNQEQSQTLVRKN